MLFRLCLEVALAVMPSQPLCPGVWPVFADASALGEHARLSAFAVLGEGGDAFSDSAAYMESLLKAQLESAHGSIMQHMDKCTP